MLTTVLLEALGLKDLDRAGWVRRGLDPVESVAAHSWGVAWLVLVLLPEDLDRERALAYAVLHDLPEVRTGDLVPGDDIDKETKARREHEALADLLAPLPRGPALRDLWSAYEAQQDPEARFVKQLDRLDMALQAVRYADRTDADLTEFLDSAAADITHPTLQRILAALRERYQAPDTG